jgi:hypothetical protein
MDRGTSYAVMAAIPSFVNQNGNRAAVGSVSGKLTYSACQAIGPAIQEDVTFPVAIDPAQAGSGPSPDWIGIGGTAGTASGTSIKVMLI